MTRYITSESVGIGHPDKTCDYIADSFLDAALEQDPYAQMAVECAIKDDLLMIYGEATTTANIDYDGIASNALREIGYDLPFIIVKEISAQSPDINSCVVTGDGLKANDQGMVYGYATDETPEYMPLPIVVAHKLVKQYETFRKTGNRFFADVKSQVSIEYEEDKPRNIHTVLLSASHAENLTNEEIRDTLIKEVISPVLNTYSGVDISNVKIIINPSGRFTIWGSHGDSGCVGRKIVVDTYGGIGRIGGGCFSSKNATKVDRSGAYYARYAAKNVVAHGYASRCEISAAYAIGLAEPICINIETFGTGKKSQSEIEDYVKQNFDFRPQNIIDELDLLKPIYRETAVYGHFGREGFPWEKIKD